MCFYSSVQGQTVEEDHQAIYEENIKLEYINEVYIPRNIEDAIEQLDALSNEEGRAKMIEGSEEVVADRLVFGLGKWMIVNWNFYEGSRLSHHIKTYGVTLPDDMAKFLIVSYYRHLKEVPLELEKRGEDIFKQRQKEQQARNNSRIVISEKTEIKKQ